MTPQDAYIAISVGINKSLLTWEDLAQFSKSGLIAQKPTLELTALQEAIEPGRELPAHIDSISMTVLEVAISENDHMNIPEILLKGRSNELRYAINRLAELGFFDVASRQRLLDWAAKF